MYALRHCLRKAHRKLHNYRPYIHRNLDQSETVDVRPLLLLAVQEQDGKFSSSSRAGSVLKQRPNNTITSPSRPLWHVICCLSLSLEIERWDDRKLAFPSRVCVTLSSSSNTHLSHDHNRPSLYVLLSVSFHIMQSCYVAAKKRESRKLRYA